MPRAERGALSACEGFRKRSANAIEFGRFTQHSEQTFAAEGGGIKRRLGKLRYARRHSATYPGEHRGRFARADVGRRRRARLMSPESNVDGRRAL